MVRSVLKVLLHSKGEINMSKKCYDHLGNEFSSKGEMCNHYGIKYTNFSSRISLGWSLEKALTEPIQKKNK